MNFRSHIRLFSVLLAGLAGASVLTIGFGLTPLSGSLFGPLIGLGPKPDFSLSSNSPTSVPWGQTGTVTVTVTSTHNLSGDVSVSATLATTSTVPPVVSIGQSSVRLIPGGSASISVNVSTTRSTSPGDYNITVQGTMGSLSHSTTLSVYVVPAWLAYDSYSFSSGTNVTLYVRNNGLVSVQLTAYSVKDLSGDYYSLTNFPGPTITVNQVIPVTFTIGSGCPSCTLSGSPFTFNPGNSYTIIITTSENSISRFTVTR